MDSLTTTVIFLSYLAAFLATWLALTAWQRNSPNRAWLPWSRPFVIMMMALAQWSLSLALTLSAETVETASAWRTLQAVGASIMPVGWVIFAMRYRRYDRLVSAGVRRLLYVVPLLTIVIALSNSQHGLMWQSWNASVLGGALIVEATPGVWGLIQILYSCVLLVAGVALFWRVTWTRWRPQLPSFEQPAVVLGVILPVTGYVLQALGYTVAGRVDPLAFFLVAGVSCLAWTVTRQQLLDLVPIARQAVLSNMPDGVLVMNNQDRLVEINPAGERILGLSAREVCGQRLVEIKPEWSDLWYEGIIKGELQTEIALDVDGERRCYDARMSPVYTRGQRLSGRLIVLRDITQHKQIESELTARRQLFENLVAVARATAEGTGLQATLQNSLDVTTNLTGAEYASLFLLDGNGRVTRSILARGETAPGSQREIVGAVMDRGVAGWVVRNRKPALIADTHTDERWVTFDDQPYLARSVLVVPITSDDRVPGVLTLQHSSPGFFDERDEVLLRAASDQMALALQKAQLFEEQIQLASRQKILYEALHTVGRHLEPGTVTHLATETITRLTGWSAAGILAPGEDDDHLILIAGSGLLSNSKGDSYRAARGADRRTTDLGRTTRLGRAYRSGHTQRRAELDEDDSFPRLPSIIFVPLNHAQRRLGVLVVGVEEAFALSNEDVQLAESLAEAVSLAMTNAQLFQVVADEHSKLQALIESSRDGIILVGSIGQILFLNHTAIDLLALTDEPEDWMYRPLLELLATQAAETTNVEGPLAELIRSSVRVAEAETGEGGGETVADEGDVVIGDRTLHWQNLPVRSDKTTLGRLIVLQDITDERRLQDMREDLTHTMVHDLRNPLNVVSGALEMLERKAPDSAPEELQHLIEIARHSTGRVLNLVNGILHISRLESGKIPINQRAFDLRSLIDETLDAQLPLAQEKGIHLELLNGAMAGDLPAAFADEELVERILQNLISNAIKFTPPGGAVSVSTSCNQDTGMLCIEVSDSGPGVPPEIRDQLFKKFVTGLHAEKGSGLGLAFCKMAVEAHGGRIWMKSRAQKGTTFAFTLPTA